MRLGSIKLLRFRGITLEMHPSFYLLPIIVGVQGWADGGGHGVLQNWWAVALVYTCVVLHEFGHALTAIALGYPVRHIVLLPFGGMALLERQPRSPRAELLITMDGPMVNFAIVALCTLLLGGWPKDGLDAALPGSHLHSILKFLLTSNLMLGCFNLLPAFPMDGGRILRALLAFYFDYLRATRYAVIIGRFVAAAGILVALWLGAYMLVVLFVFILIVGHSEYQYLRRVEPPQSPPDVPPFLT